MMKSTTSEKIYINCLQSLFCVHGFPLSLQTDNAQNFNSQEMNDYLSELNIEHRNTTPYWPQANGEIEIQNKSVLKRLRIAHAEKKDLRAELQTYLMMYRSTPHSTTGMSPAELLFRRKIRTKLPDITDHQLLDDEVRDRDSEKKGKGKVYSDNRRNAKECDIEVGDVVLVKQKKSDKLSIVFSPKPMSVVSRKGNSVEVESEEGVRYSRNITHVKKFNASDKNVNKSVSETGVEVSQYQSENQNQSILNENSVKNKGRVSNEKNVRIREDVNSEENIIERDGGEKDTETVAEPAAEVNPSPTKTAVQRRPATSVEITSRRPATPVKINSRPVRVRKMPEKYSEFVMSKK